MRALAFSILAAFALSACGPQQEAAQAPAPPVAEAPPTEEPPPSPMDAAPEQPPQDAGAGEAAPETPPPSPPPPPAPTQSTTAAPAPGAAEEPKTRSLARRSRPVATPVLVEIDRTQERRPANGGSAVVLFTEGAGVASRNTATCNQVWSLMDTATTQEVRVGVRKAEDGTVEALRPLYWLNRNPMPAAQRTCAERLAAYDYARARTIRDKYGIAGAGPHFVVARTDEQAAAVIDLTGRSNAEIADLVRYFRDGFAFQNDIWDPARNDPARKRSLLVGFFGSDRFRESMANAIGLITNPRARAGCQLGDLRDAPCT